MFSNNLQTEQIKMISVILLISIFITACGSQQVAPSITDTNWQWSEMVETEPASQSLVPNPENYTLVFASDGSVSIKADCNMVSGSYSLDGSDLTIELGPSTMAFCGEESLDQLFLGFLSNVESYSVEDGRLVLELKGGAGQMTFDKE
jgi:heat shock protein HslJ